MLTHAAIYKVQSLNYYFWRDSFLTDGVFTHMIARKSLRYLKRWTFFNPNESIVFKLSLISETALSLKQLYNQTFPGCNKNYKKRDLMSRMTISDSYFSIKYQQIDMRNIGIYFDYLLYVGYFICFSSYKLYLVRNDIMQW